MDEEDLPEFFTLKTIRRAGDEWKYLIYVPACYDPTTPSPAVISLGGFGECGNDPRLLLRSGLAATLLSYSRDWPFIVIFPQKPRPCPEMEWVEGDSIIMSILEHTRRELNVDMSRLYLTGLSEGGRGTCAVAARHPRLFAAIAPMAVFIKPEEVQKEYAEKLRDVPMWIFHSMRDNVLEALNVYRLESLLHELNADYRLTLYDVDGIEHDCWSDAYKRRDLPQWLLAHDRQNGDLPSGRVVIAHWTGNEVIGAGSRPDKAAVWDRIADFLQNSGERLRTTAAIARETRLTPQEVRDSIADHMELLEIRHSTRNSAGLYGLKSRFE